MTSASVHGVSLCNLNRVTFFFSSCVWHSFHWVRVYRTMLRKHRRNPIYEKIFKVCYVTLAELQCSTEEPCLSLLNYYFFDSSASFFIRSCSELTQKRHQFTCGFCYAQLHVKRSDTCLFSFTWLLLCVFQFWNILEWRYALGNISECHYQPLVRKKAKICYMKK